MQEISLTIITEASITKAVRQPQTVMPLKTNRIYVLHNQNHADGESGRMFLGYIRKRWPSLKRVSQNKSPNLTGNGGDGGGSPRDPGVGKLPQEQRHNCSRALRSIDCGMQSALF